MQKHAIKKNCKRTCILPYKHNNLMYCAKNVENKNKNMISLTKMVRVCGQNMACHKL